MFERHGDCKEDNLIVKVIVKIIWSQITVFESHGQCETCLKLSLNIVFFNYKNSRSRKTKFKEVRILGVEWSENRNEKMASGSPQQRVRGQRQNFKRSTFPARNGQKTATRGWCILVHKKLTFKSTRGVFCAKNSQNDLELTKWACNIGVLWCHQIRSFLHDSLFAFSFHLKSLEFI